MKSFNVPITYRSPLISAIKHKRKREDRMKKDLSPTLLDLGPLQIWLARHFGFCYGVENAIEISFRTIEENEGKRIFLLSEMIHNPQVNADLQQRGVRFLQDTGGRELIPFSELTAEDIVLIPAFGTTLQIEKELREAGITIEKYNTTCPFVEKVWNRSEQIAAKGYSIVIHGKPRHEETRATFSHASSNAPSVVINDMDEAIILGRYITGELPAAGFYQQFAGRYSPGFDVTVHLQRIGVVNQTTQLATDTQAIADYLRQVMKTHYGLEEGEVGERFADTRDTLCYATNDNQGAVTALLNTPADLAIVAGGYNSSNTTHLVELCEEKLPTYFIHSAEKLLSPTDILHYDFHNRQETLTTGYLPGFGQAAGMSGAPAGTVEPDGQKTSATGLTGKTGPENAGTREAAPAGLPEAPSPAAAVTRILMTSGASCPDAIVEGIIRRLASFYGAEERLEQLIGEFQE